MLIVQGVFRSGTTVLFRALRRDPDKRCYYEPLHPNLLDHVREADAPDPEHEKSPLYAEYLPLRDCLAAYHRDNFAYKYDLATQGGTAPRLTAYLRLLAEHSSEPVLQFNRAFWLVPWLSNIFPASLFVHVVRDPRSVVWSQLTTASETRVRMDWPMLNRWLPFSSGNLRNVFSKYAYHGAYDIRTYSDLLSRLVEHASEDEPIRRAYERIKSADGSRPYVQALALWGAQVEICHHHAQRTFGPRYLPIRYEDFCTAPYQTLQTIYARHEQPIPDPVCTYAKESVHTRCLDSWRQLPEANSAFRTGIREADIEPVMETFGYM